MKLQLITLTLTALTLYGCGPANKKEIMDNTGTATNAITDSFWQLETLEGKTLPKAKNGENKIGFALDEKENRITGFAGCNSFFGTYRLEAGNRINFSALGATKMACLVNIINEADFLEIFGLADNYRITGDRLELNVGKRSPLAVFKKVAATSEPVINIDF